MILLEVFGQQSRGLVVRHAYRTDEALHRLWVRHPRLEISSDPHLEKSPNSAIILPAQTQAEEEDKKNAVDDRDNGKTADGTNDN